MELDVTQMAAMAIITTLGLILITEVIGRDEANLVQKFLAFLAIAPIVVILIRFILQVVFNIDDPTVAEAASAKASEDMIALLPEMIVSTLVGELIGTAIWGVYKFIKSLLE